MKHIYLDYAAATPMDTRAVAAMKPFFAESFYNPSALYQSAREVRRSLEKSRAVVADALGVKDKEIIFTAGGTEANNMAIHGVMQQFPGCHMVVSAIEHESVLTPASQYGHTITPVAKNGLVDLAKLAEAITEKTVLVSVMYANNEIGVVQPLKQLTQLVATIRKQRRANKNVLPLYVHTDAAQASNYLDLHISRLNVDMMTLNGGKIYAAKQSGALYIHKDVKIKPFIQGGNQEFTLRSGTENIGAISAFATMLQIVQNDRRAESHRLELLRDKFIATLLHKIPNTKLNGHPTKRLANNINLYIPAIDGERLVLELDEAGIMLATGSACTASSDEPSHVLRAIGCTLEQASASLRITLGRQTTEADLTHAASQIIKAVESHRKRAATL